MRMIAVTVPYDATRAFLEFRFVWLVLIISGNMHSKLIELQPILDDRQRLLHRANAFQDTIIQRQRLPIIDDPAAFCRLPVKNVAQGDVDIEPMELRVAGYSRIPSEPTS